MSHHYSIPILIACFAVVGAGCREAAKPTTQVTTGLTSNSTEPSVSSEPTRQVGKVALRDDGTARNETTVSEKKAAAEMKAAVEMKARIEADKEKLRIINEKLKLNRDSQEAFGALDSDQQRALLAAVRRLKAVTNYDELSRDEKAAVESFPASKEMARESARKQALVDPLYKEFAKAVNISGKPQEQLESAVEYGRLDASDRHALLQIVMRLKVVGYNGLSPEEQSLMAKNTDAAKLAGELRKKGK